ncbi:metal-dependent hydrolase [Thermodesulfatator atlanticus]|uniref:metal-dependent hydrolase n=1 Tax=Thermodesulfatator atlanticus TaxID=501497 RepID=UPI0003B30D00|nr:metal-dependent hydrolase [Thermodesulfatator atlanticus]
MKITFYGHATFKIVSDEGTRILIDPWLDNPKRPAERDIGPYDLILITHAHGDHLGNVFEIARTAATEVVSIHEIQQYLLARGIPNVTGMNIGGTYRTKGIVITMVPAFHSSSIQEDDNIIYGGDAAGFVIQLENGKTIYHAGDTGLFYDMKLIGELYQPEIAMLPIGDHYVMGPREAAKACELLQPKIVIPMHFGTFPLLTGTPQAFQEYLKHFAPQVEMKVLEPGETLEI